MGSLYQYIVSTGTILTDTSSLYAANVAEYQAIFGSDLVTTPDSPAGVLITADTTGQAALINNNAAVGNQINPNIAGGVFLDAVMALLGIARAAQSQTYVTAVTLSGAAGTVIPQGTLAATAAGDQFATVASCTIGAGGTITVDFKSVAYGPIPCATNALNIVVTSILGWETVTNANAGVLGTATQSDVGARAYRNNTLGYQGVALPVSITSALYNVPGVSSVWFQENVAATTQTINGISMVAHSIYAVVNGGSNLNVAAALLENKSSGCAWNGGTSISVVEPASGQTYTVKFDYATPVSISIQVTSPNGDTTNITNAIIAYVAGTVPNFPLVTGSAWGIGGEVSAFEIAAAISAQYPQYLITNVEISLTASIAYATTPIQMAVNQIAYATAGTISVTT